MKKPLTQTVLLPVKTPYTRVSLGPLDCWIEQTSFDWRVAFQRDPEQAERWNRELTAAHETGNEDLTWRRFPLADKSSQLKLSVHFPARSVVIRPEEPYLIAPGGKVQFFMSVPLVLRISFPEAPDITLLEEPAQILSNTWFGEPISGELCYSSRTRAKRSVDDLDNRKYRIVCPVRMKNASDEVLVFERFCLRVPFLRLYAGREHLWSNEVGVTYRGPTETSRVAYHPRGPSFDETAELVSEAAEEDHTQFKLRSFYSGMMGL